VVEVSCVIQQLQQQQQQHSCCLRHGMGNVAAALLVSYTYDLRHLFRLLNFVSILWLSQIVLMTVEAASLSCCPAPTCDAFHAHAHCFCSFLLLLSPSPVPLSLIKRAGMRRMVLLPLNWPCRLAHQQPALCRRHSLLDKV
jgi:hypothetical protein